MRSFAAGRRVLLLAGVTTVGGICAGPFDEAARGDGLDDERVQALEPRDGAVQRRSPALEVDRDHGVVLRRVTQLRLREREQPEVDAVAVEDPREAAGD